MKGFHVYGGSAGMRFERLVNRSGEPVLSIDAAARLGCPLGSVSGRLCKARQRLLERLTARGVAPAAVVGVGLTAGAAGALPSRLFDAVRTFPVAPTAASRGSSASTRACSPGRSASRRWCSSARSSL